MARMSMVLAAPRYRHFFPVAPEFAFNIPSLALYYGAEGQETMTAKFQLIYIADGSDSHRFPTGVYADNSEAIGIFYNNVQQDNRFGIIGYGEPVGDPPVPPPIFGYWTATYDPAFNGIHYTTARVDEFLHQDPPQAGTEVRLEITNRIPIGRNFFRIDMREHLIQGANPIDPTLIDPNNSQLQFQGAYRCHIEIVAKPFHGVARVSDDKLAIEYRPDRGYVGVDSFSYRLVSALGQASPAKCVRMNVG